MTRRAFGFSLSISLAVAPVASAAQPLPNATVCAKPHVDAHAVHLMEPVYPNSARLRALSGTVTVKVTLDETGMLQAVSIYKSSGDADLDQAALDAAQKSTYAPEFENCRPVGGAFLVRMDFTGALAEPCPIGITEIVATTDKSVWAVRLDSWRQTAADVRLKLYTVDTLYVARAKQVEFTERSGYGQGFGSHLRPFRSSPIFVRLPADAAIDAAAAEPPDGTNLTCVPDYRSRALPPSRTRAGDTNASTLQVTEATSMIPGPRFSTLPPPTCATPYRDATVTNAQEPDYPAIARQLGNTGTVVVIVGLSTAGAVSSASVLVSSGSPYLDAAALEAARKSRYAPQIFRCEPISGHYLFRADFSSQ